MNFLQAKKQVVHKRIIGGTLAVIAGGLTGVGIVKSLYIQLGILEYQGLGLLTGIKQLIAGLYYLEYFPRFLWPLSPAVNLEDILTAGNIPFFISYAMFFVGIAFFNSANDLSRRMKVIKQKIVDLELERSMMGESTAPSPRKFEDMARDLPVEPESFFKQIHSLYIAPVIVAIILWLLKIG